MERRVDFYQLADDAPGAQERYACRLAEKALRNGHTVLVLAADATQAARLDALLWSFSPESFVPHGSNADDPVYVGLDPAITGHSLLVNLSGRLPPDTTRHRRLAEVVPAHPDARAAARQAWARYRELGLAVHYHDLGRPRPPAAGPG